MKPIKFKKQKKKKEKVMIKSKNERGFKIIKFYDSHGELCSIQRSSSIDSYIWLGIHEVNPIILCEDAHKLGLEVKSQEVGTLNGWQSYEFPNEVQLFSRMHLSKNDAKNLIKILKKFIRKGDIY